MPDKFDPYRERLVVETETTWAPECALPDDSDNDSDRRAFRQQLAKQLHASAAEVEQLEYVRTHTGFCRRITVTPADLARLAQKRVSP